MFGNCGVLQGISQGKGFVNMSTVDVETAIDVCEVCSNHVCLGFILQRVFTFVQLLGEHISHSKNTVLLVTDIH